MDGAIAKKTQSTQSLHIEKQRNPLRFSVSSAFLFLIVSGQTLTTTDLSYKMKEVKIIPVHYIVLSLLWVGIIVFLSHQPGSDSDSVSSQWLSDIKNLMHFPVFGLLALWIWLGTRDWFNSNITAIISVLVFILVFGALDEWHQSFIPGRYATVSDVLNDFIGALVVLSFFHWKRERQAIDA